MRKYLLAILVIAALSLSAKAQQYTTVTAHILDPVGSVYQNCGFNVDFNGQSLDPGPYLISGSVFQTSYQGAKCDGSGNFSINLPANSLISPGPSFWTFNFCDQTGKYCGTTNITITGITQDISAQLQVVAPVLPRSANSLPVFGLGSAVATTNLSTFPATNNCVKWSAGGVLDDAGQACGTGSGGGGSGNVSTSPTLSQKIVQPVGTEFSSNDFAGIKYVVTDYRWSQAPSSPANLIAGSNTVTLSPCPQGVNGSNLDYYVYIQGGGNEAVKVTGGSCTSGAAAGTIIFTTAATHPTGYTVGTASGGLTEAIFTAKQAVTNPTGSIQNGYVVVPPNYQMPVYATAYIQSSNITINFSGSIIECNVLNNLACVKVGNDTNANSFLGATLINPRFRAMVPSTGPALEVNASNTKVYNVVTRNAFTGGYFGSLLQVDDDQAFLLDGMVPGMGTWARCDATFCSTAIVAPGPFNTFSAVGWLKNLNLGAQCQFNGIDWQSGNTLHVTDAVIQGNPQFGIRTGTPRGGFGPTQLDNVYEEVGNCTNPQYTALGATGAAARAVTGLVVMGNAVSVKGGEFPTGSIPTFTCSGTAGANTFNYWVVVRDSVLGASTPLWAGKTASNCSGTVTGMFPWVQGTNTITYDIIRNTGVGAALVTPNPTSCTGGSLSACGSVVLAQAQCGVGPVCTFTDNASANTVSYAVPNVLYKPKIFFWPGNVFLGTSADGKTDGSLSGYMVIEDTSLVADQVISITGNTQPSIFSNRCPSGLTGGALTSCLQGDPVGNNNGPQIATILPAGPIAGGSAAEAGLKGRLNFWRAGASSLPVGTSIITLVDSDPKLTAATSNMRPTMSANDSFIANDLTVAASFANARIAYGAPVSQSFYIASLPDGTNYKMRIDGTTITLKEPLTTNSSLISTGGTVNFVAAAHTIPTLVGTAAAKPATCTTGELYFATDATAGTNLYMCTALNTWTQMSGGGGNPVWSSLQSPSGNLALNMGNNTTTFTSGTNTTTPWIFQDTTANVGTGALVTVQNIGTSAALPFKVINNNGGTGATFQSSSSTAYALSIPLGGGNLGFNRAVSTSTGAQLSGCSICFGPTDAIKYGTSNLILAKGNGNAAAAQIGDTFGIELAGNLSTLTAGLSLTIQPKTAAVNTTGGTLNIKGGNTTGTGANGDVILTAGSGGSGEKGVVSIGTDPFTISVTNDATNPTTLNQTVCVQTTGNAGTCSGGSTTGAVGVCIKNCGGTGSAQVAVSGQVAVAFDSSTVTSGDFAAMSSLGGLATDLGSNPGNFQTIGVIKDQVSAGSPPVWNVLLAEGAAPPDLSRTVVTNPSSGNVIIPSAPAQIPLIAQCNATSSVDCFQVKKPDGTIALKVDKFGVTTMGGGSGTVTSDAFISTTDPTAGHTADAGTVRMAKTDTLCWRNNAFSGNVCISLNGSDQILLNGVSVANTGAIIATHCGGTVGTANATSYGMVEFTNGTGTGCSNTAITEAPVPMTCTAKNLRVTAGTAGAVGGSGVVTLYKNTVATTLTCTLGTGTSCNDTTHTVAFTGGDTYSVKVLTGQATDTTANVRASFQCQ